MSTFKSVAENSTVMSYSTNKTLDDFMELQQESEPLYQFFKYIIENTEAYQNGELSMNEDISLAYGGTNVEHIFLDAIAFGVFVEQKSPAEYRDTPISNHFTTPNGLQSMDAVIDAQPHAQIGNFFRYMKQYTTAPDTTDPTPPPTKYDNVDLTELLYHAILFGKHLEMWNADNLENTLGPLNL